MSGLDAYEFQGTERYEVRGKLGSGTSGDVYRVHDRKLGTMVALKTLHKSDPVAIHRFKKEFRSLADVNHPNLVQLYELESADADRWFFTMELVDGFDFIEYTRPDSDPQATKRLTNDPRVSGEERLRAALRQLSEGLVALHNAGMLHRDIKPSNIRVTVEGRVVLLDFGLVKELYSGALYETIDGTEVSGTPAYMAPEQAAGLQVTPASDWYSVGAILYEALTGRIPFAGGFIKILTDKQKMDPPAPQEIAPGIPDDLAELSMELQSREMDKRPNGEQVLGRLGGEAIMIGRTTFSSSSTLSAPFIGRDTQLRTLVESLEKSRQGQASLVLVEGSSGMGKSALVRRFLNQARETDESSVLLAGRCYERESVPYKAFDELIDDLSRYLRRLSDQEVEILMPTNVLALARLFPALRRVQAVAGAQNRNVLDIPDSRELRRRAFSAFREMLYRLAQRHPLVLHIDDLQWGDLDSVALLNEILRPPDPPPMVVVVCYLSEEQDAPFLQELLAADFGDTCDCRQLLVEELSPVEAQMLAMERLGNDSGSTELASTIARESGGSPFFIDELVRSARAEAGLGHGGTDFSEEVERTLASKTSLENMVFARLRKLSAEAQRLLAVVAVSGSPIEIEVARQAAELGRETQAAITSLRGSSLVRIRSSQERDQIEPYHARITEAMVSHLDKDTRKRLHQRLAVALDGTGRADPETLALHFHEAGEIERAAAFATEAAEKAKEALAFDRAARLYRLALSYGAGGSVDENRRLQVALGESLSNAGRGAEAAQAFLKGAEGAMKAETLELRRRAAEQLLHSGHMDEGQETVSQVLASIGMKLAPTARASLMSLMRSILRLKLRGLKFKERDPSQIAAEELIRVDTCWSVCTGLSTVDTIRGMDFGKRNLILSLDAGEPYRVARALAMEAGYVGTGGTKAEAKTSELLREAMTLAERVNNYHALGFVNLMSGMTSYLAGRWRKGLELLDRAEAILRDNCTGVTWELDTAMAFQLRSLLMIGDLNEIRRRLPGALQDVRDKGDLYAEVNLRSRTSWVVLLVDDKPEEARQEADAAIALWSRQGFHIQHYWHMTSAVEIALYQGDPMGAWRAIEEKWPQLEKSMLLRIQFTRNEARYVRARAALAAAAASSGDEAKTLRKIAEAEAKSIASEKIFWTAPLAQLLQAGLASLDGNKNAALDLLIKAAAGFESSDMEIFAAVSRRCRGLLMGTTGERFVNEAAAWMKEHNVRDVERLSSVFAPGRWTS